MQWLIGAATRDGLAMVAQHTQTGVFCTKGKFNQTSVLSAIETSLQFSLQWMFAEKNKGLPWSGQPFALQLLGLVAGVRFELTTFGL
jgi:hypothetical protein